MVFEFKFTKNQIAYLSHHIQVLTYGIILDRMGFDTSKLFYAIVTADPVTKGNKKFRSEVIKTAIENGPKEAIIPIRNATVHVHKFKPLDIESQLCWAIDYWKNSREAALTNNLNKCSRCEYQTKCRSPI